MKITKFFVVLLCFLFSFQALAEDNKVKPFANFNLSSLKEVLSGEKVVKVIESEGLPAVVGRMMHVEAEKLNQLNGLEFDQLSYGKAAASYNALPADLTAEMVLEIRDDRGLHFLPADYKEGDVHPSVKVEVDHKPRFKPEVTPSFLQGVVSGLQNQLARLRAENANNVPKVQKIDELVEQVNAIEQGQKKMALDVSVNAGVLEGHQKLLNESTHGLQRAEAEIREMQGYPIWGIVGFCVLSLLLLYLAINLKRFTRWVKKEIVAIKEQLVSHSKSLTVANDRLDEHDRQIDQISAEMLDLPPEDTAKISRENLVGLPIAGVVRIMVPMQYGNDLASAQLIVSKIDEKRIKVNIPKSKHSGTYQTVDVTSDVIRMLRRAVREKRFGPSVETKAA